MLRIYTTQVIFLEVLRTEDDYWKDIQFIVWLSALTYVIMTQKFEKKHYGAAARQSLTRVKAHFG